MTNSIFETKEQYTKFRATWAIAAQAKQLTNVHHCMLNLIRGLPIERGFSPVTRTAKLRNGHYANSGVHLASWGLMHVVANAKLSKRTSWAQQRLDLFMEPFGDTLSTEQLAAIVVTTVRAAQHE